ncbi:MAG: chorismate synthase [Deltaproteobacteria bacterium]|nr:chorismate synthase [Deltaproteobacteria bacterium]
MRFLTAGESHGPALTVIIEGMPAGVPLRADAIDADLRLRQRGHGRGGRMQIEHDTVEILGGVRHGATIGSPLALLIRNRDFANWRDAMVVEGNSADAVIAARAVHCPRPGHADLAGGLKYDVHDLRNIVERASARETAARMAAGSVARVLLREFDIEVHGQVRQIGSVVAAAGAVVSSDDPGWAAAAASPVRCADAQAGAAMVALIDAARFAKETVGGVFEIHAFGVPPGLGSHVHWDRRLDGLLAQALMSIPGVKGVEIGLGFAQAALYGSKVHDAIAWGNAAATVPCQRLTNHAGGLEGGISNGEPIVLRAVMKPLATVMQPLPSVDLRTKVAAEAHLERSDICVVPAASVVGEAMVAWVLAAALCEKCGGDTLVEMQRNYRGYLAQLAEY